MQDINGNGLPDDEWYELKGSEAGKEETIQNFEVTYYRPEGKKMDVQWISSDGRNGWVDYLSAYHTQDYYYPAWISENSYTKPVIGIIRVMTGGTWIISETTR